MAPNIYQAVKQAMQDLIAPQLESLKGEIGALRAEMHGEIGTLKGDIGTLRTEMHGEIGTLRAEMRGNHTALVADIRRIDDKLTWALDLRERIVAIETKLAT